jgi:pyruvate formate lyase activating enzyme
MTDEGTIFSIEEFAVHDGPGIRTTIFLKGCPLRCEWCHNPEGISPEPQWMDKKGERTMCGRRVTVDEMAALILRNKEIYAMNNGGITFTGGEPLLQAGFVKALALRVRPAVHTAIETSGYAAADIFAGMLSSVDLVMFDVKHMDPAMHKQYTGVDNAPILRNLETLCRSGREFIVRVPLIPGVNDTERNMRAIMNAVRGAEGLVRIELLRYHKMAGAKYSMIGRTYSPTFDPEPAPQVHNVFEEENIKTIIL